MLNFPSKPLIITLLAALSAASSGIAAADDKRQDQNKPAVALAGPQNGNQHPGNGGQKLTVRTGVITVTNQGYGPLTITTDPSVTRISGNGSFAIVTPGTGIPCAKSVVVPPRGGECTIGVQYTPTGAGGASARVTLTDSGAKHPTQDTIITVD